MKKPLDVKIRVKHYAKAIKYYSQFDKDKRMGMCMVFANINGIEYFEAPWTNFYENDFEDGLVEYYPELTMPITHCDDKNLKSFKERKKICEKALDKLINKL